MSNSYQYLNSTQKYYNNPHNNYANSSPRNTSIQKLLSSPTSAGSSSSNNPTLTNTKSYTPVPISYERNIPINHDAENFYPPLPSENTSNLYIDVSPAVLKKQEQEIQSQLSPSFWARLNEATKPVSYSYDYSTLYNSSSQNNNTQTNPNSKSSFTPTNMKRSEANSFKLSGYHSPYIQSDQTNSSAQQPNRPTTSQNHSNIISQLRQNQTQKPSSASTTSKQEEFRRSSELKTSPTVASFLTRNRTITNPAETYNNRQNVRIEPIKTLIKPNVLEKSQTFVDRSQLAMESIPLVSKRLIANKNLDENLPPGVKLVKTSEHVYETGESKKNSPALTLIPQNSQSRTLIVINKTQTPASSFQINLSASREKISEAVNAQAAKAETPITIRNDTFQRSKSLNPADRNRIKSFIISSSNNPNNRSNFIGNMNMNMLMPNRSSSRSLTIRSRVNNYYTDFDNEKNSYNSNLVDNKELLISNQAKNELDSMNSPEAAQWGDDSKSYEGVDTQNIQNTSEAMKNEESSGLETNKIEARVEPVSDFVEIKKDPNLVSDFIKGDNEDDLIKNNNNARNTPPVVNSNSENINEANASLNASESINGDDGQAKAENEGEMPTLIPLTLIPYTNTYVPVYNGIEFNFRLEKINALSLSFSQFASEFWEISI